MSRKLLTSYLAHGGAARAYTPVLITATQQATAWGREARLVLALAARQTLMLDEARLLVSDVHDLQALRISLTQAL